MSHLWTFCPRWNKRYLSAYNYLLLLLLLLHIHLSVTLILCGTNRSLNDKSLNEIVSKLKPMEVETAKMIAAFCIFTPCLKGCSRLSLNSSDLLSTFQHFRAQFFFPKMEFLLFTSIFIPFELLQSRRWLFSAFSFEGAEKRKLRKVKLKRKKFQFLHCFEVSRKKVFSINYYKGSLKSQF